MHAAATTIDVRSVATPQWSSGRSTLWMALLLSALIHAFVGVPLLAEAMRSASLQALSSLLGSPEERAAALRAEEERQDEPQEPLELLAGIDAGDPVRMTWIGYADYQKHLAQLSTVEQAAFTESVPGNDPDGNGSAGPGEPAPAPGTLPTAAASAEAEPAATQPTQPTPRADTEAEATTVESGATETGPQPIDAPPTAEVEIDHPPALPSEGPRDASAPAGPAGTSLDEPAPQVQEQPNKESAPPEDPPETHPEVLPTATPANPATASAAQAGGSGTGGGTPGGVQAERSDREADARSIIDVPRETWINGRPLAARGVEIHTRKPVFPLLTRITTSPANPLCQIEFDRRGKPVRCRVLQSSGYASEIDEPVLDALYRWRATGRELDRLRESETATFRIRVLLR